MARSYYEMLGVPADASADTINQAYQTKLQALNDAQNTDRNQLIVLREIHQVLSNPLKRQMYDQSLIQRAQARMAPVGSAVDADMERHQHLVMIKWLLLTLIVLLIGGFLYYKKQKASAPQASVISTTVVKPVEVEAPAPEVTTTVPVAVNNGPARNAEQIFSELSGSVARINVSNERGERVSLGSGVVIGPDTVITNCHVTQNGRNFQVRVGGENMSAQLDVEDREFDLCSLRVGALRAPAVRIGAGQALSSGQKVYAIGAPHGLDLTISDGIVSGLREVAGGRLIQTTAPVSPGSSGGGLFDAWGNLVGIVTFQHSAGQNLNFAVPAEWIREMRNRNSSRGSVGAVTIRGTREGASSEEGSEQKILGRWACREALGGRSFDLEFFKQGRLIMVGDDRPIPGRYEVGPKKLRMVFGQNILDGVIEEWTERRLLVNFGNADRTVCERRN